MTKFDIRKIVNGLVSNLSERSKDVVLSRFGIGQDDYDTLEAIGQRYGITRERVRQIEADALRHINTAANEPLLKPVQKTLADFIRSRGGVMAEEALVTEFATEYFDSRPEPHQKYHGAVNLFLSLDKNFTRLGENDSFRARWGVNGASVRTQENVCANLVSYFKKSKNTVSLDELVSVAKGYSQALNRNIVLAYLAPAKNMAANAFGGWGLLEWPEVKPRGVRDKAYLVLKRHGQSLHFTEVAQHINQANFSKRVALAQTVHNELIKDNRFVLVGRGLYALKSWGYEAGTVKDVIKSVLVKNGPMSREAVVQAVLSKRMVKPSTILLNLNSFRKRDDNKYILA